MSQPSAGEPFEFRFDLDAEAAGPGDRRALVAFVREQLQTLLTVVELTHQGRPVRIDGFRLQRDPEVTEPLFPGEPGP